MGGLAKSVAAARTRAWLPAATNEKGRELAVAVSCQNVTEGNCKAFRRNLALGHPRTSSCATVRSDACRRASQAPFEAAAQRVRTQHGSYERRRIPADVAKPVDARDLKSLGRKAVRVRPPPSAPLNQWLRRMKSRFSKNSSALRQQAPYARFQAMLNELATELGAALGQERIYVAFADRTWILDAGEHRG